MNTHKLTTTTTTHFAVTLHQDPHPDPSRMALPFAYHHSPYALCRFRGESVAINYYPYVDILQVRPHHKSWGLEGDTTSGYNVCVWRTGLEMRKGGPAMELQCM